MNNALVWGYAHIILFVLWLALELGVFLCTAAAKNPQASFEKRSTFIRTARRLHVIPRICFALILPVGVELTGALNVYPLTPGLRAWGWVIGLGWLALILVTARYRGRPFAVVLGYLEMAFQVLMGAAFVVYGLNSLATGAPIDEPWFALKLALFGLVFWTTFAVNLTFRPFAAPFAEIGEEGSAPEREESVARAVNHTLVAMAILYLLIVAIAFIGRVKPF